MPRKPYTKAPEPCLIVPPNSELLPKELRERVKAMKASTLPHLSMWLTNQLVDYQVRDDGIWLRDYNVRLATFAPNSHALREVLTLLMNEAYKFGSSLTREQTEMLRKLPKPRAQVSKGAKVSK